jgi:crossover junction endodeoxyribonuclease RusA
MQESPIILRFTLPLPPSVNNQYVTVGRRRVLSKPAQAFNKDVAKIVEKARRDGNLSPEAEAAFKDALIGVYLTFYFETPNRRDLDGGLKIALDALCRALGIDDRAVVDLHLTKRIDPLHPHLDIELETISDWTFDRSYVYLGEEHVDSESPWPE